MCKNVFQNIWMQQKCYLKNISHESRIHIKNYCMYTHGKEMKEGLAEM